ncbi:unnamed protein product [Rotaria magnacalcarata]|uniref:UBC core domain-containing protein n=1 Tax=Rotaria magnacalcarata TaxID=392030 RepID=A0A814UN23_9BILA|nr:unnamed protein product [Rotaria magnacalcarata]CAF4122426.1 unnamed protein product [Rotaria magnacalcarata]
MVPAKAVISDFIEAIWQQVNFSKEKYSRTSHLLLLFNHRLHIFTEYVKHELVSEFLQVTLHLSPQNGPHFYIYAIRREQEPEMYTYHVNDGKTTNIFDNSDWWNPIHFDEYGQSARPQSILLSSLYALQLFFKQKNTAYTGINQGRESQFFAQLRTFMFLPAVLAFKHAMQGSLFWFEKPLIVDALLALLNEKCLNEIKRSELGDCAPLLFCWLLCKCNVSNISSEEHLYPEVDLTYETTNNTSQYFCDPVTISHPNRTLIQLTERANVLDVLSSKILRHVDIGSLTQYLANPVNYYSYVRCQSPYYCIYNPSVIEICSFTSLSNWENNEIEDLYKSMNRICPTFSFITKGAMNANVHDQLVLLQDCTVALIIERKNDRNALKGDTVDHLFHIYNPIAEKKRTFIKNADLYDSQTATKAGKKISLPVHLSSNICTDADYAGVPDLLASQPTTQITVVLLDQSSSMSDKIVASDLDSKCTNADMSTIMLSILSDNLISTHQSHAFGLIHFAASVDVRCPITRDRDRFEKALNDKAKIQQHWTCMYDAISKAISLIVNYERDEKVNIARNCKKLIICISDGIDNYGPTKFATLRDRLKKYNDIVIDYISFAASLTEEESKKVLRFRELCRSTHGYVYKNLPLSNIQLGAMFEQDAAVWISERDPRLYGLVEKPTRKIPDQLYWRSEHGIPATCRPLADPARNKRLTKEVNNVLKANIKSLSLFVTDDINFWKVLLKGPNKRPYAGGLWMLYVKFGAEYPSSPPDVRFITNIFHVNISGDGKICHQILNRAWSSQISMVQVLENILSLLEEPNFDDAVSVEKAHLHDGNEQEYLRQAEHWTLLHASRSREDLKREFDLIDNDEGDALNRKTN